MRLKLLQWRQRLRPSRTGAGWRLWHGRLHHGPSEARVIVPASRYRGARSGPCDRRMSEPEEIPRRMSVSATPETEIGVYANFVAVWHEAHCFVLDFAAYTQPPQLTADVESGEQFVDLRARLVSRVRIPP